jgi:hypothetical protein
MKDQSSSLFAYLATLIAIVVLTLAAAIIVLSIDAETHLAQLVAALGFIGGAVTGLIGVIGTFRPRQPSPPAAEETPESQS